MRSRRGTRPTSKIFSRERRAVYGFDLAKLAPIAAAVGPTHADDTDAARRNPGRRHQPGVPAVMKRVEYAGSVHDEEEIEAVVAVLARRPDRVAHRQATSGRWSGSSPRRSASGAA